MTKRSQWQLAPFYFFLRVLRINHVPSESNDRGLDFPIQKINIKAGPPRKIYIYFYLYMFFLLEKFSLFFTLYSLEKNTYFLSHIRPRKIKKSAADGSFPSSNGYKKIRRRYSSALSFYLPLRPPFLHLLYIIVFVHLALPFLLR